MDKIQHIYGCTEPTGLITWNYSIHYSGINPKIDKYVKGDVINDIHCLLANKFNVIYKEKDFFKCISRFRTLCDICGCNTVFIICDDDYSQFKYDFSFTYPIRCDNPNNINMFLAIFNYDSLSKLKLYRGKNKKLICHYYKMLAPFIKYN